MTPTLVANKHKLAPGWESSPIYKYIGRGSKLGNRYSHMSGTKAEFKVDTRAEAITCCEADFRYRLKHGDAELRQEILACKGKILVCFCSPMPCHGSVIIRLIENIERGLI